MGKALASREPSAVAARIRSRLQELGLTETKASIALGWTRGVLSATLRRLDEGGALTTPTLALLETLLGRSQHWILTGEAVSGVKLRDCKGWAEAAAEARRRYHLTDEQVEFVGATTFPEAPRYVDPQLIRALADAL